MPIDSTQPLPRHVAIIMDGNRRWARKKGLLPTQGHRKVAEYTIQQLVDHCLELGIKYLTLWAFSTENWKRSKQEVAAIMELFREAFTKNAEQLAEKGIKLNAIGDLSRFPQDIQNQVGEWLQKTDTHQHLTVTLALNYGGRDELLRAVNKLLAQKPTEPISADQFSSYLDTSDLPDPDLVIRTGGECRLSGYLPWQTVYSELYFTDTLMPEFGPAEFDKALQDYLSRERRFGR